MRNNAIVFRNLRAEMSRSGISIVDMATQLGLNRDTLSRKLANRSNINLNEAFEIQQKFFPNMEISYLFEEIQSNAEIALKNGNEEAV